MSSLVSVKDFARLAGVRTESIYQAMKRPLLSSAIVESRGRRFIDPSHPDAERYLRGEIPRGRRHARPRRKARAARTVPPVTRARAPVSAAVVLPEGFDPLAPAMLPGGCTTDEPGPRVASFPVAGPSPGESSGEDVSKLGQWTLDELVARFGDLPSMVDHVKARKLLAETELKRHQHDVARGQYIARDMVEATLLPLIETTWSRCVGESPGAIASLVVATCTARLQGGGHVAPGAPPAEPLDQVVEELIRREYSTVLGKVRDEFRERLGRV